MRPASNMPTTVQSRDAKRTVSPIAGTPKAVRDRAAGHDLGRAGPEHPALDQHRPAVAARRLPASRRGSSTFDGLPVSRFGRLISTTGSFDTSRAPVGADRRCRAALSTIPACSRSIAALHFGLRRAADDDDVVGLAGRDQRLPRARPRASAPSRTRRRRAPSRPPSAPSSAAARRGCARCTRTGCVIASRYRTQAIDDAHAARRATREARRRRRR